MMRVLVRGVARRAAGRRLLLGFARVSTRDLQAHRLKRVASANHAEDEHEREQHGEPSLPPALISASPHSRDHGAEAGGARACCQGRRIGHRRSAPRAGLALIPIVLATGSPGNEIQAPMSAVILGGLTSSTLLNLLVIPPLFARFGVSPETGAESTSRATVDP